MKAMRRGGGVRRRRSAVLALAMMLVSTAPGEAFVPTLSDGDVATILQHAKQMVADHTHGLAVKDYVLYDRPNPLRIEDESKLVDAVLVATPSQRLLYRAYLEYFQEKDFSQAAARKVANGYSQSIGFRIFAHALSAQPEQREFLQRFGPATLTLEDGTTLTTRASEQTQAAEDFFIVNGRHEFRWLGALSYIFDLPEGAGNIRDITGAAGVLSFADPEGREYSLKVNLSNYE